MPFLENIKELRRRSRASFRSTSGSATDSYSNSTVPTTKSSSTLNSSFGHTTPPYLDKQLHTSSSSPNLVLSRSPSDLTPPPIPTRPPARPNQSNRNSMAALSNSSSATTMRPQVPASPFAPKITSVVDRAIVYHKLLIVSGEIGDPSQRLIDGQVTVFHTSEQTALPTAWPVHESHFKALVYLSPGWNNIKFEFTSAKLSSKEGAPSPIQTTQLVVNYLPLNNVPPLQLVILQGSDSSGTFDAPPERVRREGNSLDVAIRKYRTAAHLWQAFTAEQMSHNGFGRRCFRFEEEWQLGTLSGRDFELGRMKNETKVHVIRCDRTVAELRDMERAQQNKKATKAGELFGIAKEAIEKHFLIGSNQKQYFAVLLLDSHWDKHADTILGHAALGGHAGNIQLAIFGSHALHSYPSCLEEVVPTFSDCTRTDTNYVANDCNESGTTWEAANLGIGSHLHEVGHLFGCPHQDSGIMARDFVKFNRSFMSREYFSTRTNTQGQLIFRREDECAWHRLDALRLRMHPCFRVPSDPPLNSDDSIQVWPVEDGRVLVTAATGVAYVEIYPEGGSEHCQSWIDYSEVKGLAYPTQVCITDSDLRQRLPETFKGKRIRLEVHSIGGRSQTVMDFAGLLSKASTVEIPEMRLHDKRGGLNKLVLERRQRGFKSQRLGFSNMDGTRPDEVILDNAHVRSKLLLSIKIYHGFALDGLEFCYEDGESQLFGKRGGKEGGDEFFLDTRRSEMLMGFYVRSGQWIDGIQLLTTQGRKSDFYGNPAGGGGHTLIPPRGYHIAGIAGTVAKWVDGFQIIITRG